MLGELDLQRADVLIPAFPVGLNGPVEEPVEGLELFRRAPHRRLGGSQRFQHGSNIEQVVRGLGIQCGDEGSAVVLGPDEALSGQDPKCFTQRDSRHSELFGEPLLTQALTGLKLTTDNCLADQGDEFLRTGSRTRTCRRLRPCHHAGSAMGRTLFHVYNSIRTAGQATTGWPRHRLLASRSSRIVTRTYLQLAPGAAIWRDSRGQSWPGGPAEIAARQATTIWSRSRLNPSRQLYIPAPGRRKFLKVNAQFYILQSCIQIGMPGAGCRPG